MQSIYSNNYVIILHGIIYNFLSLSTDPHYPTHNTPPMPNTPTTPVALLIFTTTCLPFFLVFL